MVHNNYKSASATAPAAAAVSKRKQSALTRDRARLREYNNCTASFQSSHGKPNDTTAEIL